MKYIGICAYSGNLKPIRNDLKKKTKDSPCYISELYIDPDRAKTSHNFIIANITKHIRKTFYRNYSTNANLCSNYINGYLDNRHQNLFCDHKDINYDIIQKINTGRCISRLIQYLNNNALRGNYINNHINKTEIETAIRHHEINKAVGIDNIPSKIFKMNIQWRAGELREYFKFI